MNNVVISGKIEEIFDMTEGIKLGKVRVDDSLIYVFWEEENFSSDYIEKKFISIQGRLSYIKFKKENSDIAFRRLAVHVERMEVYDL